MPAITRVYTTAHGAELEGVSAWHTLKPMQGMARIAAKSTTDHEFPYVSEPQDVANPNIAVEICDRRLALVQVGPSSTRK